MRGLQVALLLLGWHAAAIAADLALPELMRELAQVPAAQARFTEIKHMSVLQNPLTLSGRLAYVRPDRIERHVLAPYEEKTVVSGDRVTIENRSRNTSKTFSLESAPGAYALTESLRATLAGDLAALERHYSVDLKGNRDDWTLTLTPREAALSSLVQSVLIAGAQARILRFDVRETNGDHSTMTIRDEKP
jgi:outer membrane lipoprotein-sorting protein